MSVWYSVSEGYLHLIFLRDVCILRSQCTCSEPHERLEGAATSKAAEYPRQLCTEFAFSVEHFL